MMNFTDCLISFDSFSYHIIRILFSALWQSSVLFMAVGVLVYILRRGKETVRHVLWVAAILIMPLLPFISWMLSNAGTPQKEIPVFPVYSSPHVKINNKINYPLSPQKSSPIEHNKDVTEKTSISPAKSPKLLQQYPGKIVSILNYPWAAALVGYMCVSIFFLLSVITGRLRIQQWIRNGDAVIDERTIDIFEHVRKRLGLNREITIIQSRHAAVPFTFKTFQPVVLLPEGFAENLSDAELTGIAVHELTHIKRNDALILTVVSMMRAIFFFHPLMWFATREVSFLAETACDNAVLEITSEPATYAHLISRIAESLPKRVIPTEYAVGIIFSKRFFYRRIMTILSAKKNRIRKLSRKTLVEIITAVVVVLAVVLAFPLGVKRKSDGKTITVSGKVLYEGKPISKAKVYLHTPARTFNGYDQTEEVATTKKDGSFTFKMDSYKLNEVLWALPSVIVYARRYSIGWKKLSKDMIIDNLSISVGKSGTIAGTVTDKENNPVKNADIKIRFLYPGDSSDRDMVNAVMPEMVKKTGDYGKFIVTNILKGSRMSLEVTGSGYARELLQGIHEGTENVECILTPEVRIDGRVTYHDTGKPAKNVSVQAAGLDFRMPVSNIAKTDNNGRYSLSHLHPGLYHVSLVHEDEPGEWTAAAQQNVSVIKGETSPYIELQLIRGGSITGRITDKDTGEPLPGHHVIAMSPRINSRITFGSDHTDENGVYRIRSVPGKVKVTVHSPTKYNATAHKDAYFTVVEGETVEGVDFELNKDIEVIRKKCVDPVATLWEVW